MESRYFKVILFKESYSFKYPDFLYSKKYWLINQVVFFPEDNATDEK